MIECQLLSENLYMDGETSPSQMKKTLAKLNSQKVVIITEFGYTPTDKELFGI